MSVGVERGIDGGMAETYLEDLGVNPFRYQERSVGGSEIMEPARLANRVRYGWSPESATEEGPPKGPPIGAVKDS